MELKQIQTWINANASFYDDLQNVDTPIVLFDECISKIEDDLSNKKVLVLYNVEAVMLLLLNYKVKPQNIYFFTQSTRKQTFFKQKGINIFYVDIAKKPIEYLNKINMKFDVVIGNPPYLKGTWIKFIKLACELSNKHVNFISPNATQNLSTRGKKLIHFLKTNGLQKLEDCTNYFDVSSGKIAIYTINKQSIYNEQALIDNSISGKILNKVLNTGNEKLESLLSTKRSKKYSSAIRYTSTNKHRIKNLESINKVGAVYSFIDRENTTILNAKDYWLVNRFFGKNKDCVILELDEYIGISSNILAIKRIPNMSLSEFKKIYLSDLYKFILNQLRNGGFDTAPKHINQLPKYKNKVDLYKHYNLTQEEIEYIESTIK
jgi:hypothetical protein